jgi:hypothetical protein
MMSMLYAIFISTLLGLLCDASDDDMWAGRSTIKSVTGLYSLLQGPVYCDSWHHGQNVLL